MRDRNFGIGRRRPAVLWESGMIVDDGDETETDDEESVVEENVDETEIEIDRNESSADLDFDEILQIEDEKGGWMANNEMEHEQVESC
jgi:hypothetical protein